MTCAECVLTYAGLQKESPYPHLCVVLWLFVFTMLVFTTADAAQHVHLWLAGCDTLMMLLDSLLADLAHKCLQS